MAAMKVIQCREHGGSFEIESRRGRPPVRCTDENPCDMVKAKRMRSAQAVGELTGKRLRTAEAVIAAVERDEFAKESKQAAKRSRSTLPKKVGLRTSAWCTCDEQGGEKHERGIEGCKYATRGAAVVVRHNPSIPFAMHARTELEPLGWTLTGTAGVNDDGAWAEVIGRRDTETIILRWEDGKLTDQTYTVWDEDVSPAQNGKPKSRLPFNPDEMTDSELVKEISGRQITWWNRLAKSTEKAVIPGEKIQIEHTLSGTGHESARIVKFVDHAGTGFRAFHIAALMRVK